MKKQDCDRGAPRTRIFYVLLLTLLLTVAACARDSSGGGASTSTGNSNANQQTPAGARAAPSTATTSARINVAYKLDSRVTTVNMGERWVSPPTYDVVAPGVPYTVEATAEVIGSDGRTLPDAPQWTVEDPQMVVVAPAEGNKVTITVQRAGKSELHISAQDMTKTLSIQAMPQQEAMRVTISQ